MSNIWFEINLFQFMNCASHVTMESANNNKKNTKESKNKTTITQLNDFAWFVQLRIFVILWNHFFLSFTFFLFLVNLFLDVIWSRAKTSKVYEGWSQYIRYVTYKHNVFISMLTSRNRVNICSFENAANKFQHLFGALFVH